MDGLPEGQNADGIVENAAAIENRRRNTDALLHKLLEASDERAFWVVCLFEQFVLAEGKAGNKLCSEEEGNHMRLKSIDS